jgi:hypothetical protein
VDKGSNFPAVTTIGPYDKGADHMRHQMTIAAPRISRRTTQEPARALSVTASLTQRSSAVPALSAQPLPPMIASPLVRPRRFSHCTASTALKGSTGGAPGCNQRPRSAKAALHGVK